MQTTCCRARCCRHRCRYKHRYPSHWSHPWPLLVVLSTTPQSWWLGLPLWHFYHHFSEQAVLPWTVRLKQRQCRLHWSTAIVAVAWSSTTKKQPLCQIMEKTYNYHHRPPLHPQFKNGQLIRFRSLLTTKTEARCRTRVPLYRSHYTCRQSRVAFRYRLITKLV